MKNRITLIVAFIGMITLQSCVKEEIVRDNVDYDTISEVFEYSNVDFNFANGYNVFLDYPHTIYASDMVLIYHLYDVVNGEDIWRLMPQTYYLGGADALDYNFDFTRYDANIFLDANFDLNTLSAAWTQNQVFRVVVIPGNFGNKSAMSVDINDYHAIIKFYNINENKISKIRM